MIVIVSSTLDISTQNVLEWLDFYGEKFIVTNKDNPIRNIEFIISNEKAEMQFSIDESTIQLKDLNGFWYRRETLELESFENDVKYPLAFQIQFDYFTKLENKRLKEYLSSKLKLKSIINNEFDNNINKLIVLEKAVEVGLLIPYTKITNQYIDNDKPENFILKPISEAINFYYEKYMCRLLTNDFSPNLFTSNFPTLLQTNIKKLFEIRAFFLGGKFYSIAIFSQQNSKSKIDYRNYDFINKNRSVPFTLPVETVKKCKRLMESLKLNSGSIDLIYTDKNEFVFLEVNPIGQFDNVSKVGNYYLEQKIANILTNGKD